MNNALKPTGAPMDELLNIAVAVPIKNKMKIKGRIIHIGLNARLI